MWLLNAPVTAAMPAVEIPFNTTNLHPAFKFTADQCKEWVTAGQKMAAVGQGWDKLAKKFQRTPAWVRGKQGKASARVWCFGFDGGYLQREGFRAQSLYEDPCVPEHLVTNGGHFRGLVFEVLLASPPRNGQDPNAAFLSGDARAGDPANAARYKVPDQVSRHADDSEVQAIKFVLSDDKGHHYTAAEGSTNGQDSSGTATFMGQLAKPTDESANMTVGGLFAQSTYTRTEYIPYSQRNPYFRARYLVTFPLFDEQGQPRIAADVSELTLHIVTPKGEMKVKYKLGKARSNSTTH
jgi:hypothetical protein